MIEDLWEAPPAGAAGAIRTFVGMFDVLEHLPDDVRALECLRRTMTPGGRLVLTVPAHMSLWSDVDQYAGHYRRYGAEDLRRTLTASGFRIEYLSQFMAALFPLMWLSRRTATLFGRRREEANEISRGREVLMRDLKIVPGVNGLMGFLLDCELPLLSRRWRLPVGTSLLAVATPAAD